jgi:hypothetical protein
MLRACVGPAYLCNALRQLRSLQHVLQQVGLRRALRLQTARRLRAASWLLQDRARVPVPAL